MSDQKDGHLDTARALHAAALGALPLALESLSRTDPKAALAWIDHHMKTDESAYANHLARLGDALAGHSHATPEASPEPVGSDYPVEGVEVSVPVRVRVEDGPS